MSNNNRRLYYFSVGFSWSNGRQFVAGTKHIASEKSELTASEAVSMATQDMGLWSPTMVSFSPISKAQYDCFEKEIADRERARVESERRFADEARRARENAYCAVQ